MKRKQLPKLVEEWRKVLLPEWRVTLLDHPPPDHEDDDYWALCQTKDDYLAISVYFTDECLERSDREIEITVVHEMLHALTRPWRKMRDDVFSDLPRAKYDQFSRTQEHEEEQLVDRLAYVLVAQTHGAEAFGTVEGEPTGKAED